MEYQGDAFQVEIDSQGIVSLGFNLKNQAANVFSEAALKDLSLAVEKIKSLKNVKGLVLHSLKDQFVLGADIYEFIGHFKKPQDEMVQWITQTHNLFSSIEDLPYPTATAINGFAFGGGFEICLTTDYRILEETAKVGLLETKLGIIPGWGGTVRLSRLVGADHAIEWVATANQYSAKDAFQIHAVDGVVKKGESYKAAKTLVERAIAGSLDWKKQRARKTNPLTLNKTESIMVFENAKGYIASVAGKNYPAPLKAVHVIQEGSTLKREDAFKIEAKAFAELSKLTTTSSLVYTFLGDQYLKKVAKKFTDKTTPVQRGAVLGAGIMGGGISYQAASRGVTVLMKDVQAKALDAGMKEASTQLLKQVERGKIKPQVVTDTLSRITPVLTYGEFKDIDAVVEAVVENKEIKKKVLKEVEETLGVNSILASNTSTIPITELALDLKRPENFCGMHFFNPVPKMPLVEVIRGKKTSEATIAKAVQYVLQMNKTPIVVNDCPGFLVNRVLFPYFFSFVQLVGDGVDFQRIDKVMEKFGWPMGPAYLLDVVGIDTGHHAAKIMMESFPDRMSISGANILQAMFEAKRFGQKNGVGFYNYAPDAKGKIQKIKNDEVDSIINSVVKNKIEVSDEDIINRMMLPMILECARCLEEKIVESATEVDMGLLLGLGFPPFRFGALKYADDMGITQVVSLAEKFKNYGGLFSIPQIIEKMKGNNEKFYKF